MASVAKRAWDNGDETKTAWVVRYTDSSGKRRLKTFKLKKDADRFRTKVETELETSEHIPEASSVAIARLSILFLEQVEARVEDGRVGLARFRNLQSVVRTSIAPMLGHILVKDLTTKQVEDFYRELLSKHGVCPKTAKDRVYTLKLMQDFAIRRGYLARRPVSDALMALRGIKRTYIRTFCSDDINCLLEAAKNRHPNSRQRTTPMLECIVHLAAFCGLRYGEIMGLTTDNIDTAERVIRVRHSLCLHAGLKGPKTSAGVRDIPLPPHLTDMLKHWLEIGYIPNPDKLVFRNGNGGMIRPAHFHQQMWHPLLKRAGLWEGKRYHFHALRHFAASWMIAHQLPVTDVANLMGHASFDMTLQVYAHPVLPKDHRREALDRMAANLVAAAPRGVSGFAA